MANHPKDSEPSSWHRYFAVEANNRAWDLAEKPSRTEGESLEMLNAAHAAALHWNVVGNELNRMRANTLLALVHGLAGSAQFALWLAESAKSYFASQETDAWEIAIVHCIHALAAAAAGDAVAHRDSYSAAQEAVAVLSDPEERRIVKPVLDQVPAP